MARKSTAFVVASWVLVVLCAGFIFFMSSNTDTGLNDDLGLFSLVFQMCIRDRYTRVYSSY